VRVILAVFAALLLLGEQASADVLITPAEAALPASADVGLDLRGMTRGPSLDQISPKPAASVRSPFALKIKFAPHNNTKVDVAAARVTYLRLPPVDLTERLKKYTRSDGIDMPNAEAPPGTHLLRVELKDSLGRTSISVIKLIVE
jgi:hypothetical protein